MGLKVRRKPQVVASYQQDSHALWFVYVLWSPSLGRTYTGIALDPAIRMRQHNGILPTGAKATRAGRPWQLRYVSAPLTSRGMAQSEEMRIKSLPPAKKRHLFSIPSPDVV